MKKADSEESQWIDYLSMAILKERCPVCCRGLKWRHSIAHIASCNFNGPNLANGFLAQVKARDWQKVIEPFSRLSSMDMMACEVVRCPDGFALIVWVEVDLVTGGDQFQIYMERIEEYALSQIQQVRSLEWISF